MFSKNLIKFVIMSYLASKAYEYLSRNKKLPGFIKELEKEPWARHLSAIVSDLIKMRMLRR